MLESTVNGTKITEQLIYPYMGMSSLDFFYPPNPGATAICIVPLG